MPHAVTWFDIRSNDPKNLAAFYKKAFKWKIDPEMGMIQAEKEGGQQGIAGSLSPANGGPGGVLVYVTCPDIDAQLEKVKAAGGTPMMPKMDLPNDMGSIATFTDPQGNTVGLWAPAAPAKGTEKRAKKASKKAAKKASKKTGKKAPPPSAAAEEKPAAKKAGKKKAAKKAGKKKTAKKAPPRVADKAPSAAQAQENAPRKAPAKKAKKAKKKGKK